MSVNLAKSLEALGCQMQAPDFRDLVVELHAILHPAWTIDELVCHPSAALEFCRHVCERARFFLPEDLILRTLMNSRRTGGAA